MRSFAAKSVDGKLLHSHIWRSTSDFNMLEGHCVLSVCLSPALPPAMWPVYLSCEDQGCWLSNLAPVTLSQTKGQDEGGGFTSLLAQQNPVTDTCQGLKQQRFPKRVRSVSSVMPGQCQKLLSYTERKCWAWTGSSQMTIAGQSLGGPTICCSKTHGRTVPGGAECQLHSA